MVRKDLTKEGSTINEVKSNFFPHQIGEWLGFTIDLISFKVFVPTPKIQDLNELISRIMASHVTTAISLITGTIKSMGLALGPIARSYR